MSLFLIQYAPHVNWWATGHTSNDSLQYPQYETHDEHNIRTQLLKCEHTSHTSSFVGNQ